MNKKFNTSQLVLLGLMTAFFFLWLIPRSDI